MNMTTCMTTDDRSHSIVRNVEVKCEFNIFLRLYLSYGCDRNVAFWATLGSVQTSVYAGPVETTVSAEVFC